jgi:hypothetical protein
MRDRDLKQFARDLIGRSVQSVERTGDEATED